MMLRREGNKAYNLQTVCWGQSRGRTRLNDEWRRYSISTDYISVFTSGVWRYHWLVYRYWTINTVSALSLTKYKIGSHTGKSPFLSSINASTFSERKLWANSTRSAIGVQRYVSCVLSQRQRAPCLIYLSMSTAERILSTRSCIVVARRIDREIHVLHQACAFVTTSRRIIWKTLSVYFRDLGTQDHIIAVLSFCFFLSP